jgi:hypothetical protein
MAVGVLLSPAQQISFHNPYLGLNTNWHNFLFYVPVIEFSACGLKKCTILDRRLFGMQDLIDASSSTEEIPSRNHSVLFERTYNEDVPVVRIGNSLGQICERP